MKYQLGFSITIHFTLTDEEYKLLTDAIQSGEKSHEATIGNFWYGNMNSRMFCSESKEECMHTATTRQMDVTILKSLEKYVSHPSDDQHWKLGKALYYKLYKVLKNAIDMSNLLNNHSGIREVQS